jgi:hypothetical protein
MSVIVELTIDDEDFLLGQILADPPDMRIELERIVPTGEAAIPYLWVTGSDLTSFETRVRENDAVSQFKMLDHLDDWALWRIEWADDPQSLLEGITESGGVIMEGRGNRGWEFQLRFPDHNALSQFYNYCMEQGVSIHIERSFTMTGKTHAGYQLDISQEQREALLLGLRHGYFETPSETSLTELAEEFDISEQALSNRIRRGTKTVLESVLLSKPEEFEGRP